MALNRNSQYVASLVSYINDTKPYHAKLSEIVEEYQFSDSMNVHFTEGSSIKTEIDSAWLYNYYSGGDSSFRTLPLKQLHSPLKSHTRSQIQVGIDEVRDMAKVPFVYSKKTSAGVADVRLQRAATVEPLVEGLDYFSTYGSFQFRLNSTYDRPVPDPNAVFDPTWADTRDINAISTAAAITRQNANDVCNQNSSISVVRLLIDEIQSIVNQISDLSLRDTVQQELDPIEHRLLYPHFWPGYRAAVDDVLFDIETGISNLPAGHEKDILIAQFDQIKTSVPTTAWFDCDWQNFSKRLYFVSSHLLDSTKTSIHQALDNLQPRLPRDYEPLLNILEASNIAPPAPYDGWLGTDGEPVGTKYVDNRLSELSPSLYFGLHTDSDVAESGRAQYNNVTSPWLNIFNITASSQAEAGDTWSVVAADDSSPLWEVFSGVSGFVGSFIAGDDFVSSTISFSTSHVAQATQGDTVRIKNRNRIVFGGSSPLETWNIIKVNPLAYSRPVLQSTRYGFIRNVQGVVGKVTLLDATLPTGTIILTARESGTTFDLSSTADSSYVGVVPVGQPFNDGRIAFTIVAGTAQPFFGGDRFYIDIVNEPARPIDLNLGFGYDLDPYDHSTLKDDAGNSLNFVFDTRFTDYNTALLNLEVDQSATSGRKWRIRAIPDLSRPIATIKKDGSGPTEAVDLQDATSGQAPDVAADAAPLYNMANDENQAVPDLRLYYASEFNVLWSDDDFHTVESAGTIAVGQSFTSVLHGIQFTLTPGSKEFIGVLADDGPGNPIVEGGDVFSFEVLNAPPIQTEDHIGLVSSHIPRLVMHGSGFFDAPPAVWTVGFSSPVDYTVDALYTEGSTGTRVYPDPLVATLTTPGLRSAEGASFKNDHVHFTVVGGDAGLATGDSFVFNTFAKKPSYLVHGSKSGWQKNATVGESYWNGFIGFTIEKPTAKLFDPALEEQKLTEVNRQPTDTWVSKWELGSGTLTLERLRFDCADMIYSLLPTPNGWKINRSDVGTIGWLGLSGTFKDDFITLTADGVDVAVARTLQIVGDDFDAWNAQDTIIVRPTIAARNPTIGEFIQVDKRTKDRLAINLNFDQVAVEPALAPIGPVTIDARFIDTYTGAVGTPLARWSPETAILRNWLPLTLEARDSTTSVAEFSDTATEFDVRSAVSGELIGSIKPIGENSSWPAQFEWTKEFFESYLPLNTEANIVTYGSGFNDQVRANITESVKFLIGGGALTTDRLFADMMSVTIDESNRLNIVQHLQDQVGAQIADSWGNGFLPGFDNEPLGEEAGLFDSGLPLVGDFHEAKVLFGLTTRTVEQEQRLSNLLDLLHNFLTNGDIAQTTLIAFLNALAADPIGQILTPMFGIPAQGLGIDITIGAAGADARNPSDDGAAASIQEAMVFTALDSAYSYDAYGYDVGGYDTNSESTAILYSGSLPPVPMSGLPLGGSYEAFETPLVVSGIGARVFQVSFTQVPPIDPTFYIWLPNEPEPLPVAVVEKVTPLQFRISVPSATEAKLILT